MDSSHAKMNDFGCPGGHSTAIETFAALKSRNYARYWIGLVFYVLGYRAEYVTIAWLVWEFTQSPLWLAYLGFAQGIPLVCFQLFAGVLADRVDRLRLLLVTQGLACITLMIAFAMTLAGMARVELLIALAALLSVFRAFDEPARMSLVPQLIDEARLSNAIALGSIPWQAGRIIGPSITGVLIGAFGGVFGFALAAVASLIALGLYGRLDVRYEALGGRGQRILTQLVEGLRFVAGNFVFASLIGMSMLNSLFGLSYITLLPIFADWYFKAGSSGYGVLSAAHGIGALTGTLAVATIASRMRRPGQVLLGGATGMGLMLIVFAYSPWMGMAMAAQVAIGFCNTFYLTQVNTWVQQNTPTEMRGRVMSLYALCWNLLPIGGLIGGAVAAAVNARFAVALGGAIVAVNAMLLLSSRRLRTIR